MSGCLWLSMFYHCLVRNGNKTVWLWIYVKKIRFGAEISTFTTLIMLKGEYYLSVMSSSDISSVTMVTCPWSPWLCVPQLWRNNQSTIAYSLMVSISDTKRLLLTLERPSTLKNDAKEVQCTGPVWALFKRQYVTTWVWRTGWFKRLAALAQCLKTME